MNNIKISEMTEATSLGDSDLLTIVQGGVNKKITKTNAIGNIITALNNPTYVTGSGTSPSLSNTRVGEMSILPKGNTEQDTTTGKNLLNIDGTRTSEGLTNITSGTVVKISGKSTNTYSSITFNVEQNLSAGTYTFSIQSTLNSSFGFIVKFSDNSETTYNITSGNKSVTFTTAQGIISYRLYMATTNGTQYDLTIYPMLETGSSATSWEPYTNGASPNPSYPQEVKTVTGENTIKINGRNLTNTTSADANNGITFEVGSEINITNPSGSNYNDNWNMLNNANFSGKTYTFYTLTNGTTGANAISLDIYKTGNSQVFQTSYSANTTYTNSINVATATLGANDRFTYMRVNTSGSSTANLNIKVIIVEGSYTSSTIGTYEPYQSQSYELNLGGKNLFNKDNITSIVNGTLNNDVMVSNAISSNYGGVSANIGNFKLSAGTYYLSLKTRVASGTSSTTLNTIAITPSTTITWGTRPNLTNEYQIYSISFTLTETTNITNILVQLSTGNTNAIIMVKEIMISKFNDTSYAPYFTPIELCKIGDYQDYIYNNGGKWFKHKEVEKTILNGTENWNNDGGTQGTDYRHNIYYAGRMSIPIAKGTDGTYLSNYFAPRNVSSDIGELGSFYMSNAWLVFVDKNKVYDLDQWKTWLSTHNTIVYYVLATPVEEEITEPSLIYQLDNLQRAKSYYPETNITTITDNVQPILEVKALEKIV